MSARRVSDSDAPRSRRPPATTPEGRENQLISAAVDLAEQQIRDGTASAQVLTHFLKLGSSREKLEQARLAMEVEFMDQKREQLASQQRQEEMYSEALHAMRRYSGAERAADDEQQD
jgi:hypothetical protein